MSKTTVKADSSEPVRIPVRRRRKQGAEFENLSVSVPKELAQTINGIVVKTAESRSKVITELLEKGLQK